MPYIGKQPLTGAYQLCDSITTSATATYNLLVGGSAVIPGSANNCIVSLNGVVQAPVGAFTVSGSQITFASALTASDVIDFILILGNVFDIGKPTDGSVTNASVSASAAIATTKLGTGAVLQVVQGTHTTSTSNSTTTYADTGLTASITPSSSSNKILVLISHGGLSKGSANGDSAISIRLVRNSTNVQVLAEQIAYQNLAQRFDLSAFFSYLDSPSTTSATTYKTQFANSNTSASVTVQSNSIISIITLIEIAG